MLELKAIYAGSFDPLTNGHFWMVEQGAKLFDELEVAIGINPSKKYMFDTNERIKMLEFLHDMFPNVTISTIDNKFLVKYAKENNATHILRGLRTNADYDYEFNMRQTNADIEPSITSVFLMSPSNLIHTSSSTIKSLIGVDGWEKEVDRYLPYPIYNYILYKNNGLLKRFRDNLSSQSLNYDEEIYTKIINSYVGRSFHNIAHIAKMLNELDEYPKVSVYKKDLIEIAIWYHDIIYDPKNSNNEKLSADMMEADLEDILHPNSINIVRNLILATRHNQIPPTEEEAIIMDLDICGLAKDEFKYGEIAIRKEYNHVDNEKYNFGRKNVLLGLRLYTDYFKNKYDTQLHQNMKTIIKFLDEFK